MDKGACVWVDNLVCILSLFLNHVSMFGQAEIQLYFFHECCLVFSILNLVKAGILNGVSSCTFLI